MVIQECRDMEEKKQLIELINGIDDQKFIKLMLDIANAFIKRWGIKQN